jgi:rubrerythrin
MNEEPKLPVALVPADVMVALDRMCSPLHESRLSGVTAAEDARCMKLIRDYVTSAAPQAPAVSERELAERDEDAYVIERLSTILADVAIALKGPEIPRHRHSYHDLVEVAQTLKLEVDLYRSCAVSHPTALAEGGELVTWKCNCCTHEFSAGMERPACPNCKAGDQYTYRVSCPRCRGMNCGATDGVSHSLECQAEHAAAIAGGRFVKDAAARDAQADDKKPIREPGYDIHGDRLG